MSSRFASADPRVRTAVMGLIAVAVVLSTAACSWIFPPECPGPWFGEHHLPEKVEDSVRGHAGPVWGRAGGSDVVVFGWDEGREDGGSLYMVRADGTGLTLLSPSIGDGRELGCFDDHRTGDYRVAFDTSPAVSPDGRTVAYHTLRQSIFPSTPDIVRVHLDGGELERLSPVRGPEQFEEHTEPAWSPDGTRIAFRKAGRLHTMAADGSDVVGNAPGIWAPPEPPAWSPDGTRIAFRGVAPGGGTPRSLYIVGADGSDLRLVADGEPDTDVDLPSGYRPRGVYTAVWSPDGQRIALVREVVRSERPLKFGSDAQVLDLETGTVRTVLKDAVGPLVWSPDGTELLFYAEEQAPRRGRAIYAVTVDGDPVIRRLGAHSPDKVIGMSWSPDGAWLAVRVIPRSFGGSRDIVWVISADGSDTHSLAWVSSLDGSVKGRYGESAAVGEAEQ